MSAPEMPQEAQRYLTGLVDLVRRTGASNVQIRYQDDDRPTVWIAVAEYPKASAIPNLGSAGKSLRVKYLSECAAGLDPVLAVYRLAERLIDGGQCVDCRRMTMLWESWSQPPARPRDGDVCHLVFDPELATFVKGCKM